MKWTSGRGAIHTCSDQPGAKGATADDDARLAVAWAVPLPGDVDTGRTAAGGVPDLNFGDTAVL
jgi:hypothetical protein